VLGHSLVWPVPIVLVFGRPPPIVEPNFIGGVQLYVGSEAFSSFNLASTVVSTACSWASRASTVASILAPEQPIVASTRLKRR